MRIDLDELRKYYRSLSDEELLATDRAELTEAARRLYDQEVANRRIRQRVTEAQPAPPGSANEEDSEVEPDWLESAGCACSFTATPHGNAAEQAARAQDILQAAGLPSHLSVLAPDGEARFDTYQVLVPGALLLKAASILDRDMFNEDLEPEWRDHLSRLTDTELRLLKPEDICAGLLDRAERLKRIYNEERERRRAT